jgi:hypothetical protein
MAEEARVLRNSLFLLTANVSAGVLNYLFQVRAAAQLDPAAYGALNGWMAYLSLALFVGSAAQIASNFFPWSAAALQRSAWLTIAAAFSGLTWLAVRGAHAAPSEPALLELGVICMVLGTLQQWTLGQFQARTWFGWMGSALVLAAIMKWCGTFLPRFGVLDARNAYFCAFPLSYGATCLFQSVVMLGKASGTRTTTTTTGRADASPNRRAWLGAIILAFAMSLLPQLDMLNLRALESDYELGLYARTALFGKAVFFAALTLLQIALPYHVRAHRGDVNAAEYARVVWLERLGVAACVVGSGVLAVSAPWITRHFLGFELPAQQRLWVLLSCLSLTALYGHLRAVQFHGATGEWRRAALRLGAVAGLYPIAQTLPRHTSVGIYLGLALGYYLTVEVIDRYVSSVWRRRSWATGH